MDELGYGALLLSSFLSATILPMSSEALLAAMIAGGFDLWSVVAVATFGNWTGSLTSYALGYAGNAGRIEKWLRIDSEKIERFRRRTEKYGAWFGLVVWVPGIGDVIAVCLGLVRAPVVATSLSILIGKAARYIALAMATDYIALQIQNV